MMLLLRQILNNISLYFFIIKRERESETDNNNHNHILIFKGIDKSVHEIVEKDAARARTRRC